MRIFFDGQVFDSRAYGGGGRYFYEVISRLVEMPSCEVDFFAGVYRTPLPLEGLAARCHSFHGLRAPRLGPLGRVFDRVGNWLGQRKLNRSRANIYHPTSYQRFAVARKIPLIVTVYDLNHERYPQYRDDPTAGWKKRAINEAAAVICISEATRQQASEIYPEATGKAVVIPLATSLQLSEDSMPGHERGRPYFLFVGNRNGYKNFRVMIEACHAIPRFAEDFSLVCFGGGKFTDEEQSLIAARGLQSCVTQQAGDDHLLARLYRDAICFIYPSLDEGFGIPLLEAMNCHCAVLASGISVFKEVAGEAASYFDPRSPDELAQYMRKMVDAPDEKQALIRAGVLRAQAFSWEQCARQHLELYASVIGAG